MIHSTDVFHPLRRIEGEREGRIEVGRREEGVESRYRCGHCKGDKGGVGEEGGGRRGGGG